MGRVRDISAVWTAPARQVEREGEHSFPIQIFLKENLSMDQRRVLDVQQDILRMESRNNHVLPANIQTKVQEIYKHLPVICQNNHALVRTDQELNLTFKQIGAAQE